MKLSVKMRAALRGNLVILLLFPWHCMIAYADDAIVLPRGVSRVSLASNFYLSFDQRYNPDGKVEEIAADFNTSVNSRISSGLSSPEPVGRRYGEPRRYDSVF